MAWEQKNWDPKKTPPIAHRPTARAYLPMGRFGKPEEIAKAALFLASDDSYFMTGHLLRVDGGNPAR